MSFESCLVLPSVSLESLELPRPRPSTNAAKASLSIELWLELLGWSFLDRNALNFTGRVVVEGEEGGDGGEVLVSGTEARIESTEGVSPTDDDHRR